MTFTAGANTATYTGNRYGSDITNGNLGHLPPCGYQPNELHTAYNMNGLYANGLDGTGETVVVIDAFGSDSIQTDAEVFSQLYGLPDLTPANFQVMHAPGALHNPGNGKFGGSAGWKDEITLDVEWVHAMAPGANIVLLISPNNGADLDETVNFAVIHHLGNTILQQLVPDLRASAIRPDSTGSSASWKWPPHKGSMSTSPLATPVTMWRPPAC